MVGAAQAGIGCSSVANVPRPFSRRPGAVTSFTSQPFADIWLVGHADVWSSPKLRAFRDVLINHCKLMAINS